jgi:hypothetical protein
MNPSTVKKVFVAITILMALVTGIVISYIMTSGRLKDIYEEKIGTQAATIESNQRIVYEAKTTISKGSPITENDVQKVNAFSSNDQSLYMTDLDVGKIALINIVPGTYITSIMLTDEQIDGELRETEYNLIHINSNIVPNDYVDVRINFPNGENYIVLSKKALKNVAVDTSSCFLWLTEEEILKMSSAIVDAFLYSGSQIYTTKYIEPNLQEASVVNYEPSLATLNLIKDNPNIVEAAVSSLSAALRKELENRLADSVNIDITAIEWDTDLNATEYESEEPTELIDEDGIVTYQQQEEAKEEDPDYGP